MKLPNKLFDILKWVAIVAFPAVITAFGTIAPAWGMPDTLRIPIIITANAVAALLGALLGISTISYKNDKIEVCESISDNANIDVQ